MLNFNVTIQRLTQGRPAAPMTLAVPRAAARERASAAQAIGPAASLQSEVVAASRLDVPAIARRVYDLMQHDLMTEHNRRGWRKW